MKKGKKKLEGTLEAHTQKELKLLGEKLKELRKKAGYTNYEQFAFENNLPRAQYGRYERGQDLKVSSLIKVLWAHDMTVKDFFQNHFNS